MGHLHRLALLLGLFGTVCRADPGTEGPAPRSQSAFETAEQASHFPPAPALAPEAAGEGIAEVAVPVLRHDFAKQLGADRAPEPETAAHEGATGVFGWPLTLAAKNLLFYLGVFVVGLVLSICFARPPPGPREGNPRAPDGLSRTAQAPGRQSTPRP